MKQREIKFIVNDSVYGYHEVQTLDKPLDKRGAHNFKGYEIAGGYVLRKVIGHPNANSRGYYPEHRLVMENLIKRFLAKDEVIHHIDGNRKNNDISNLKIVTQSEHAGKEHVGKRNPNGTLAASDPIFEEIKFRLYDSDRGITQIHTLSKLISTTFRRGKFKFRGRFTGLHDKDGKEVFEGDVVSIPYIDPLGGVHKDTEDSRAVVMFENGGFALQRIEAQPLSEWCERDKGEYVSNYGNKTILSKRTVLRVLGNIYEHPHLLPGDKREKGV